MELDRQQPLYSVNDPWIQVGSILLCHVLNNHMKIAEGYSLIAELHQESELDNVNIVVPEISEAEAKVAMMSKQNFWFTCQTILLVMVWVKYL